MVRPDQDRLVYTGDESTFPPITQIIDGNISTTTDDFEESIHDRVIPPPIYNNYARVLGFNGLILGALTTTIGGMQIFGFPFLCTNGPGVVSFSKEYFFGFTIWCGFMLFITAATAIRTTITKRQSTVNRYLALQIITTILYIAATVIIIQAFGAGSLNGQDSCMVAGHALSAAIIFIGTCLQIFSFIVTNRTIFRGKVFALIECVVEATTEKCCAKEQARSTEEPLTVN